MPHQITMSLHNVNSQRREIKRNILAGKSLSVNNISKGFSLNMNHLVGAKGCGSCGRR